MTRIMFLARSISALHVVCNGNPPSDFSKVSSTLARNLRMSKSPNRHSDQEITHTWHGWAELEVIGGRKSFELLSKSAENFQGLAFNLSIRRPRVHNTEHLYLLCCVAASQSKRCGAAIKMSFVMRKKSHSCPEGINVLSIVSLQTLSNGSGCWYQDIMCISLSLR